MLLKKVLSKSRLLFRLLWRFGLIFTRLMRFGRLAIMSLPIFFNFIDFLGSRVVIETAIEQIFFLFFLSHRHPFYPRLIVWPNLLNLFDLLRVLDEQLSFHFQWLMIELWWIFFCELLRKVGHNFPNILHDFIDGPAEDIKVHGFVSLGFMLFNLFDLHLIVLNWSINTSILRMAPLLL